MEEGRERRGRKGNAGLFSKGALKIDPGALKIVPRGPEKLSKRGLKIDFASPSSDLCQLT